MAEGLRAGLSFLYFFVLYFLVFFEYRVCLVFRPLLRKHNVYRMNISMTPKSKSGIARGEEADAQVMLSLPRSLPN